MLAHVTMAQDVVLRPWELSDAERFYEILNNDAFVYFPVRPKTLDEEYAYLKQHIDSPTSRQYNFTVLYKGLIIGSVGIKLDFHRPHIGEIGYFIDEMYWGKGIACEAVKLLEAYGWNTLKLHRLEVFMRPENTASVRVAEKCGYRKEGLMKEVLMSSDGFKDAYLFAKTKSEISAVEMTEK